MKKVFLILLVMVFLYGCGGDQTGKAIKSLDSVDTERLNSPSSTASMCSETDAGYEIDVAGITNYYNFDYCVNPNSQREMLIEYWCLTDGNMNESEVNCTQYGYDDCYSGACIVWEENYDCSNVDQESHPCEGYDGGCYNEFDGRFGGCVDLSNNHCTEANAYADHNFICTNEPCNETDGGFVIDEYGVIDSEHFDYCLMEFPYDHLVETFCVNGSGDSDLVNCSAEGYDGCYQGECITWQANFDCESVNMEAQDCTGYDAMCFNEYDGSFVGCVDEQNNDCTQNTPYAEHNMMCSLDEPEESHTVCNFKDHCIRISGPGFDRCTKDSDCDGLEAQHEDVMK